MQQQHQRPQHSYNLRSASKKARAAEPEAELKSEPAPVAPPVNLTAAFFDRAVETPRVFPPVRDEDKNEALREVDAFFSKRARSMDVHPCMNIVVEVERINEACASVQNAVSAVYGLPQDITARRSILFADNYVGHDTPLTCELSPHGSFVGVVIGSGHSSAKEGDWTCFHLKRTRDMVVVWSASSCNTDVRLNETKEPYHPAAAVWDPEERCFAFVRRKIGVGIVGIHIQCMDLKSGCASMQFDEIFFDRLLGDEKQKYPIEGFEHFPAAVSLFCEAMYRAPSLLFLAAISKQADRIGVVELQLDDENRYTGCRPVTVVPPFLARPGNGSEFDVVDLHWNPWQFDAFILEIRYRISGRRVAELYVDKGEQFEKVKGWSDNVECIQWSPDGRRIAVIGRSWYLPDEIVMLYKYDWYSRAISLVGFHNLGDTADLGKNGPKPRIRWSADSRHFAAVFSTRHIIFYEVKEQE